MKQKTAFGVPVPRGAHKTWVARDRTPSGKPFSTRGSGVPLDWGEPVKCVAWFDTFNRCRAWVAHYANGHAALVRIDMNGNRKLSFGVVPRDSGSGPKGENSRSEVEGEAPQSGGAAASPKLPQGNQHHDQ